jgi:CRISPR/Cas system-associated endonuclease Cas1
LFLHFYHYLFFKFRTRYDDNDARRWRQWLERWEQRTRRILIASIIVIFSHCVEQ